MDSWNLQVQKKMNEKKNEKLLEFRTYLNLMRHLMTPQAGQ